eukprot:GHVH01008200.1.p1 GENE.GHVH01008200.1~~GHVH01008200.1.p1  ORF type:complete len:453 (-),score=46.25 GHVH01008200.1:58-1416(-)
MSIIAVKPSISSDDSSSDSDVKASKSSYEYYDDLKSSELPKKNRILLMCYSLVSGLLHLVWYNTILQAAPFLTDTMDGYEPTSIWLPAGSLGAICGMFLYMTRPDPIVISHMKIISLFLLGIGLVIYFFIMMAYWDWINHTVCTVIVTILMFVNEFGRGYASCIDYGMTTFYSNYGINATMSVAMSVGEGIIGIIPWAILIVFTSVDDNASFDLQIGMVGLTFAVGAVVCLIYFLLICYIFSNKNDTLLMDIIKRVKAKRVIEQKKKEMEEDYVSLSGVSKLKKAVYGTRTVGCLLALSMAGTLNVFPQVFPFGYDDVTTDQSQILLGIFTLLDPVFRVAGLSLGKVFKDREFTKRTYMIIVVLKTVILTPLCVVPYYGGGTGWMDQEWEYVILMIVLGVVQGSCVVLGIYCYMTHIPVTPYSELSCGLVALYLTIGVAIGQILFQLYPLFL